MAIDFLGKQKARKKIPPKPEVLLHVPEKEVVKPKEVIKRKEEVKVKKPEVEAVKEGLGEANLIPGFKARLRKKRLMFSIIIVIIVVALSLAGYYSFILLQSLSKPPVIAPPVNIPVPVVNKNLNLNVNVNIAPAVNIPPVAMYVCDLATGQCSQSSDGTYASLFDCQSVCFAPSPPPPPQPLPATELAPLRGAVVRFLGDANTYLVENNGELRKIDAQTVRFKNGQSILQLRSQLIYMLAERFKDTRRGSDVIGYVDWDPRVLTEKELEPFIK
jgi:hypothetical protein